MATKKPEQKQLSLPLTGTWDSLLSLLPLVIQGLVALGSRTSVERLQALPVGQPEAFRRGLILVASELEAAIVQRDRTKEPVSEAARRASKLLACYAASVAACLETALLESLTKDNIKDICTWAKAQK